MIAPFGDTALLVDVEDDRAAHRMAALIQSDPSPPPGIGETVVGLRTVLVHIDPMTADPRAVGAWLARLGSSGPSAASIDPSDPGAPRATSPATELTWPPRRDRFEIPVTFDGPDLDEVAAAIGATADEAVELLTSVDLRVAFLGFAPGFPYLVGLPRALARIERRATPRTQVPPGSVALAAGFAAVYPQRTPGGWQLLGRTEVSMFDPSRPPFALLRAGDTVRFTHANDPAAPPATAPPATAPPATAPPASAPTATAPTATAPTGPDPPDGPRRAPLCASTERFVEILEPGTLTLVQDAGRRGLAAIGVPTAGAADPDGFRLANRLVGNADAAAALELTARGPTVRFSSDGYIVVVGDVDLELDAKPVSSDTVVPVTAGQVLAVGLVRGALRAYMAVAGGLDSPLVMGSRSSDVLSGLDVGPLSVGDQVDLGDPGHPRGRLSRLESSGAAIRVVPGPHHAAGTELHKLMLPCWTVGDRSNRVGLRLSSRPPTTILEPPSAGVPSCGMVTGAIQVPPDGQPIVLMPDHATVGGYPVIATAVSADWGVLGRLRPGDDIRFELTSVEEARSLRHEHERRLSACVSGWFPTDSGT